MQVYLFIYIKGYTLIPQLWGRLPQGQEKREEKEKDQGTDDETSYPNPGNGCTQRGGRTERKIEED